jgi:hypothetical protein
MDFLATNPNPNFARFAYASALEKPPQKQKQSMVMERLGVFYTKKVGYLA